MVTSFLRYANEEIEALKIEIARCNGRTVATNAAKAFGDIEAAFGNMEIDEDTMVNMKDNVGDLIKSFGDNCECNRKTIRK